jgi:putative transcriptional regulator
MSQSAVGLPPRWGYLVDVLGDPNMPNPPIQLQGKLLLADPSLRQSLFHRSVVVLNQHSCDHGAMGLILNHPTGKSVGDFLKAPEFSPLRQLAVHHGGPVDDDQLTFSSFWWTPKKGLQWAVRISAEHAIQHTRKSGRIVRAFIGHSGWTAGQLENELTQNSWITIDPSADLLGQAHDPSLWSLLMSRISPIHCLLAEAPDDPMLN